MIRLVLEVMNMNMISRKVMNLIVIYYLNMKKNNLNARNFRILEKSSKSTFVSHSICSIYYVYSCNNSKCRETVLNSRTDFKSTKNKSKATGTGQNSVHQINRKIITKNINSQHSFLTFVIYLWLLQCVTVTCISTISIFFSFLLDIIHVIVSP